MKNSPSRRRFLQQLGLLAGGLASSPFAASLALGASPIIPPNMGKGNLYVPQSSSDGPLPTWPARPVKSKFMGAFVAPKLDKIRVAFIGVGKRGSSFVPLVLHIPHVEVVACCDVYEDLAKNAAERVTRDSGKKCAAYSGSDKAYLKMLKESKPDVVIIATPWEWHCRCACDAMAAGAHAFVEVPMAISIKELWEMVDCSEKYGVHCYQLENCNYGREELMFLNIIQQGLIGDILHGEAAYIHELRSEMHEVERGTGSWRTYHYAQRNGNLYPTHGLGPVARYMGIGGKQDTFARIVSMGSPARGRAAYAAQNWPADHQWNQLRYECGDMNTSIIKTYLGRTIMLQWDETSPRPYSRHNLIQGTRGCLAGFPTRVAGENFGERSMQLGNQEEKVGNYHSWLEGEALKDIWAEFDHPLWKRVGEEGARLGGHGGMDYVMLYRAFECISSGEAMDQSVYEGALVSAVAELSEKSVAQGGMPQLFPDFTRGEWRG